MLSIIVNVFFVLVAVAMTALILMQRGAGADAGSGFGGGASATVFGARGSANFLSRSTAVLAALFFLISLGMGMFTTRPGPATSATDDLGVMAGLAVPAGKDAATPATSGEVPPASSKPAAATGDQAAGADKTVPAASAPAAATSPPAAVSKQAPPAPADQQGDKDKH
jgi:preprotein translocase subunit SecG